MAGTVSAGTIVYEVDMDTAGILRGRRDIDAALSGLNGSMGRLEASVNRTERSIGSMERTMSSLSGVAKGLIAALSVQQVASYADAWTELNNKVANSIRTGETQTEVMQRIFDISQATQSSLNGTATLYARLERGTRTYNTSAEDLSRLTTIINQGFAVSGATAQEAENAIIQLSQGLAAGALRGEEYNSVAEQGSRLTNALADSLGVSIGQLRKMAAEGKLTTDVVVNGLLSQGDAIGKEFEKTTVSIAKGLQVAGNNVTKFFGENATVKSFAAGFRDSVVSVSENLETLSSVLIVVAGVVGSRYVGALTMATSAKIADIAASRQQAIAEKQAAQAAVFSANAVQRKALADKEAALSSLALAQAEYNVARGSAAEMLAMDALVAAKTRATAASITLAEAETAQAAASARAAAAARGASAAIGLARGALSLIGGPAGAAMLAAGAIFYFWQKAQQAREEAIAFADGLDNLTASMNSMSNVQLRGAIGDANNSIRAQKDAIADLQSEVDALNRRYQSFTPQSQAYADSMGQGTEFAARQVEVSDELARKTRDLQAAKEKLGRTEDAAAEANRTLTNNMLTSMGVHDSLIEKGTTLERVQGAVAKAFGETADEINRANQAGQNFDPKALQISPATKDGDKVIASLEEQNELLKIQDERQRAIAKARIQASKVTDNVNQIAAAERLAAANYDLEQSEEARKKAQQESEKEGKKAANTAESIAQKLANLKQQSELAASSTSELSREQALLNAELSLGSGATQAQISEARQYAAAKWDVSNAIKAQAAAEKLLPEARENASYAQDVRDLNTALEAKKISQEQYNETSERLEASHQVALAKIRAEQAVTPQQDAAGSVDPVQQLANENARKLALIQAYEQEGLITHENALALRNAADTEYEQQRLAAQWTLFSQQSAANQMLAASLDALGNNASSAFAGIITGTQSGEEAIRSLANSVVNQLINSFVQMGVDWAKSAIMGATTQQAAITATTAAQVAGITTQTAASTAAAATTTAAWTPAALMSSIASWGAAVAIGVGAMAGVMALAGKRKNGGPVSAGGMYQVGEGGMPEIYQASTGKQYMIPGDNGKVISNKDMQGAGGGAPVLNIYNYSSASVDAQATQNGDGSWTLEAFIADMNNGGPASSAITSNMNVKRTPRGQG